MIALFLISHLSLRYSRGEMSKVDYMTNLLKKEVLTHEETQPFFMYAFLNFLFFNVCMLLLTAPLFIVSASVSGVEMIHILQSMILIFLFSLLSGLTGFVTYLMFGRWKITGYLLSRILYGFLLFGSGLISMSINPFYIIYTLYKNTRQVTLFNLNTIIFYLYLLLIMILLLSIMSQIMITYKEKKRGSYVQQR